MASPLRAPLLLMAVLALALAATPKQSPRLLGGLQEANVNEEGVQRAVDFAISEYNKGSNDAYHSRAMQVLRARKQIVAGVNYYLDVMDMQQARQEKTGAEGFYPRAYRDEPFTSARST